MDEPVEIVFNLWYLTDKSSGLCYNLLGRAYAISGNDEKKLARLRDLSTTDWLLSKRYKVPVDTNIVGPHGEDSYKGVISADQFQYDSNLQWIFEGVFKELEQDFPPRFSWKDGELAAQKLTAPQAPLFVCTCVMEDERGNIRPQIDGRHRVSIDG